MKRNRTANVLLLVFVAVLLLYLVLYFIIENQRTTRGPWSVTFTRDGADPVLVINQAHLGITNVRIRFVEARLPDGFQEQTVAFPRARHVPFALPFGECVFLDPMFQPGTVVMRFNGYEIQLLPRVLTIDRQEIPWKSNTPIELHPPPPTNAPAIAPIVNRSFKAAHEILSQG